jgi:sodium-dependent dicarboxylate transporter 2/3/5
MKKSYIFAGLSVLAFALIMLLPLPPEIVTEKGTVALTAAGKSSLAVLAMVVILWVTEAVAFPVAGFIGMALLVITGAAGLKALVQEGFGNTIIMFFIGVMIFSAAIEQTNLLKRLTNRMLYKLGHSPKMIILAFLIIGTVISAWITDMAVAAIMTPIAVAILKNAGVQPLKSNFGRALLISCAWGALIGGIATPAGCGPNPLTMAFLKDLAGINFSFVDWMILGIPSALLMVPCAWFILLRTFPLEHVNLVIDRETFEKNKAEYGKFHKNEVATLIIAIMTITLWIMGDMIGKWTGGKIAYLGIEFVAIASACVFFLPGLDILDWKKAEKDMGWGSILLIATGLAIGMAVYKAGAAAWLAQVVFSKIGLLHPLAIIFAVVVGISLLKVAFSSNTVTGVIMVPLLIALSRQLDLDPALLAIPAGMTSSLAFLLVTSTPTNVIPYTAGYFTIKDMAKAGIWMTLASGVCVTIGLAIFGKLSGLINW